MLLCGAIGAPMFVVVFLADGATRAGYNPVRHPVSALSLGSRGWIQIANFILTGLLMVAFAGGLRRALDSGRAAPWGPVLIALFGIGLVLSGTFVMDPMHDSPGGPSGDPAQLSWHHQLHDIAGLVVFLSLPAAALVFARRFWFARVTNWAVYSGATGVVMLAMFVAFNVAWEGDSGTAGLVQRVLIIVGWAWIALLAAHVAGKLSLGPEGPSVGDNTEVLGNHPGSATRR